MKKLFLTSVISLFAVAFSFGQGTIRGKISDATGETLIGVTMVLKSNPSIGTSTDLDGNFSIKIPDSTAQTLVISYISYKTIEETIHLKGGQVLVKNFVMTSAAKEIKEVEVTAKAVKAKEYYTESIKRNSATTLDYISSETMKKTGDVNVSSAVARITGVSSTSDGLITVRGIGDRYVKTSINGSRIPTLDPFTNNIKLDLFPASLVDNIFITKTQSPDLPGDWAGAFLSVETKDYPDQLSVNVETSIGYNSQSTFNDYISSQRSSTDWLGYDNGLRDRDHTNFSTAVLSPSDYQNFVALGLGSYYNSLGVTQQNWTGSPAADTYYRLGLVQLGLLAPALINDETAYRNARNLFLSGPYISEAFKETNANVVKTGQSFPNTWNTTTRKAPLDFSQSFSIGNQTKLFGKPLGFLFGYRYGSVIQYDPDALAKRDYPVTGLPLSEKEMQDSKQTNGWSALFNLAYKFCPNHSISLLFMPNFNGVNKVRNSYDLINMNSNIIQLYEQRQQLVYQFKSEHYLPASKIKIESDASYTLGKSVAPDFKNLDYARKAGDLIFLDPTNDRDDRSYRYLSNNLFDSRLSLEFPIGTKANLPRKFKFGGAYQNDNQKYDQYTYHLNNGNVLAPESNDIDQLLSLDNFAIQNGGIPFVYSEENPPTNHTFGNSSVAAGFAMLDYSITPSLRASGGLRVEYTDIHADVDLYDSLGYPANDPRRNFDPAEADANPSKLYELTYLPSVNLIYKLGSEQSTPINLRVNFSQSLARPSIRELSNVTMFDYELQANVTGNPDLQLVHINNYDFRVESYFKSGDNVSVSFFYKYFKDPIELVYSDRYTWKNAEESYVQGVELEGKKIIMKHLEFKANVTFTNSKTTFVRTRDEHVGGTTIVYPVDTITTPNFGQAPYILNGILGYTIDKIGLNVTASYNVQGPRLVIVQNNSSIPDVYELPRQLIDFKVTKRIMKHFNVSLTVRDVLNTTRNRSYKYPDRWSVYDKYTYGTVYVVGISYTL